MQYSILLSALCASAALAIQVTQPDNTTTWNPSDDNTVRWSSVSTDPSSVDIVLVNNAVNPSVTETIATNVPVSSGSYDISALQGSAGQGYQINLVSTDPRNSGILAQSNQFTLSESDVDGEMSSSASASASASASSASVSASTASESMMASMSSAASDASMTATESSPLASVSSAAASATSSLGAALSSAAASASEALASASSSAAGAVSTGGAAVNGISAGLNAGGLVLGSLFALLV